MTEFAQILYAVADGIATITLNRPEKMNAFTTVMMEEMCSAFDLADADDAVRAVIVTGSGNRAFCAGADLTPDSGGQVFASGSKVESLSDERVRDSGGRLTLRIFQCKKPVIAAVNGAAVGIGHGVKFFRGHAVFTPWQQVRVQKIPNPVFVDVAGKAVHRLAVHHQDTGRDAADAKGLGELLLLVGVDLHQCEAPAIVNLDFFKQQAKRLAGHGPGRPEINQHGRGFGSRQDFLLKIGNGDVDHDGV